MQMIESEPFWYAIRRRLAGLSQPTIAALCTVLIGLIGLAESFAHDDAAIFYLIPISLATWYGQLGNSAYGPPPPAANAGVSGPGQLQGGQRFTRPFGRRPIAAGSRQDTPRAPAADGPDRPARRR